MSSEGLDHQHVIMVHPWGADHDHRRCLLSQARRHSGRHKSYIAPLHRLLYHSGASLAQLRRDLHQSTSGPAWRSHKIVDSRRDRSFLRELHRAEKPVNIQTKAG
jgi:hypothetical protein